jgi:hypothetical protein
MDLISEQLLSGGGAAPAGSSGMPKVNVASHPMIVPAISFVLGVAVVYTAQPPFAVARHANGYHVSVVRAAALGGACATATWVLMKRL